MKDFSIFVWKDYEKKKKNRLFKYLKLLDKNDKRKREVNVS